MSSMTEEPTEQAEKRHGMGLVGVSTVVLPLIGLGGFLLGLIAVIGENPNYEGSGVCLAAAALAFGLLLNALLR
jgi:hypothetical protein